MNDLRGAIALLLAAGLAAPVASAQTAGGDAGRPGAAGSLEEIVVTAQKREQALIDVPISVTAIGADELARRGAAAIEDLQFAVPGLAITQFSPGQQRVTIRGVSVYSGLPTVGVYLDEMPLNLENNQSGQDVRLLDIARVEVLRGPQGTLYGQGALGGTLRYITNDVDLQSFGGSVGADFGTVSGGGSDWIATGVLNAPFAADRAGGRLAASYQEFGGWIDNPVLGTRRVNGGHAATVRGKLRAIATDALEVALMVQHQDLEIGAQNLSDANQQVFDRIPTPYTSKATLVSATVTYDFGFAELLSATGYLERRDVTRNDLTGPFAPLLPLLGIPAGVVTSIGSTNRFQNEVLTQELRLSSTGAGSLGWTVGAFYRDGAGSLETTAQVTPNVLPPGLVLFAIDGTNPSDSKSWALFGEASYAITPTLTALVGLRYFQDEREQDSVSTIFGGASVDRRTERFTALSPRFNVSWQPGPDANLYASVGRGFRSGGFNLTSSGAGLGTVPASFDPDELTTYEIGGKFRTADRRLAAELAVYYNEWKDVQVVTNVAGLPISFTGNGGKVAGAGVEGAVSFLPVPALTLTATAGWNDMKHRTESAEHRVGDPADYVPEFTGSASAEYRTDVAGLPAFLRVDYQYSDRYQVFARNFQVVPAFSDVIRILNARVGIARDRWSASLYARNLLNEDYVIYPAFAGLVYPSRMQPRVVGVSFTVDY